MSQTYGYEYNSYPVYSELMSTEGSFKRLTSFPGPPETFKQAMFGLPRIHPLTKEPITPDDIVPYLESAVTQVEMALNINLSEVQHFHSEDYITEMFGANWTGITLRQWPATEITAVRIKYPHTNTTSVYQTYNIPASWVYLRRNKINIVAGIGSISPSIDGTAIETAGGLFNFVTGFNRGNFQPGLIEVVYKAGFKQDKLPSSLADLIRTTAAKNFLIDVGPTLFPNSSVQVSIDGVNQTVSYNVSQLLYNRVDLMDKKIKELTAALKAQFGRSINLAFVGS